MDTDQNFETFLFISPGKFLISVKKKSNFKEVYKNEVIFESDRLEPGFTDIPGQWGTILLYNDSKEIDINYATIKNGTVGLFCIGINNFPL